MKINRFFWMCSCFFSFHHWNYVGSEKSNSFKKVSSEESCTWHKYECKHCQIERYKFSW